MPDVGWISDERLPAAPPRNPEGVWLVTPDFVVEIVSHTDRLEDQQNKMQNVWLANGVRLGWLIDPYEAKVHIYRSNTKPEALERPSKLGDKEVLPGLSVELDRIWA